MIDYGKTREAAQAQKQALTIRALAILEEKKRLDSEVEQIRRELIGLDQILDGVEFVSSEIPPDLEPPGFTEKIRKILSETSIPLVPTQIRDVLEANGFGGSSSRNLLISVHTVVERIKNELVEAKTPDGKTAYKRIKPWVSAGVVPKMSILEALARVGQVPLSGPPPSRDPQPLADMIRKAKDKEKMNLGVQSNKKRNRYGI